MGTASSYWLLVGIDRLGSCQTRELEENQVFFQEQFPGVADSEKVPHERIQRQLMQWCKSDRSLAFWCKLYRKIQNEQVRETEKLGIWFTSLAYQQIYGSIAESCLRCFISNQIKVICLALEQKFGKDHDFTAAEILPLVLDDIRKLPSQGYRDRTTKSSLTTRILQTFDPDKSNLSTWTNRIFKSDRLVKQFLLEHGIKQVTDWMILNYTTPGRLQRVLLSYSWTQDAINQALQLLESYHQVYRTDLLQHRKAGSARKYPEPTTEQLEQIAKKLSTTRTISPAKVQGKLQDLAKLIRKPPPPVSLDSILDIPAQTDDDEQAEFLANYRQQFENCLSESIKQVIQIRLTDLQGKQTKKTEKKVQNYLKALHLFYCDGVPMKDIASQLGFTDQPHLSHLLKLKQLSSDIRRNTLSCLANRVLGLAQFYAEPDCLRELDLKMEELLKEQIDFVIQEAERETRSKHNRVMKSQLAQTICRYLNTRKEIL